MIEPNLPQDETERLSALEQLKIMYTPAEERLDRITRLACRLFDVPIALISLVAENCQWFKSNQGLVVGETPRNISFCGHAILGNEAFVVSDASLDPRFSNNPLVTGEPFIRFYSGHPLMGPHRKKIGTLCVMDPHPRNMSSSERELLRDLAAWAENELKVIQLSQAQQELITELNASKRQAMLDSLTHLWNRKAIVEILDREVARADREESSFGVMLVDIDYFKKINDSHGHMAGDRAILETARRMRSCIRPYDAIGRYGGEEFLIVLGKCDSSNSLKLAEKIRSRLCEEPVPIAEGKISITLSLGVTTYEFSNHPNSETLLRAADQALYRAKKKGRNCVEYLASL